MTPIDKTYLRGQLAEATGVKGETIRYYEKCGLLQTPARNAAGHRVYSENHMKRLIFIRRCRELGFSLSEINGLAGLSKDERSCEHIRELTATHLADVQGKIKDLKKMEQTLKSMIRQCATNAAPDCPIIDVLSS